MVTVQQLFRKKEEEAYPCWNNRNNRCFRCEGPGHFARNCMSKKVLLGYDPTCINQRWPSNNNNCNNNQSSSWRPYQKESNYIKEDIRYYAHDPNNKNVELVVYKIDMNQEGSVIWTIIRVKGYPVKVIIDSGTSVSIITLPIVK